MNASNSKVHATRPTATRHSRSSGVQTQVKICPTPYRVVDEHVWRREGCRAAQLHLRAMTRQTPCPLTREALYMNTPSGGLQPLPSYKAARARKHPKARTCKRKERCRRPYAAAMLLRPSSAVSCEPRLVTRVAAAAAARPPPIRQQRRHEHATGGERGDGGGRPRSNGGCGGGGERDDASDSGARSHERLEQGREANANGEKGECGDGGGASPASSSGVWRTAAATLLRAARWTCFSAELIHASNCSSASSSGVASVVGCAAPASHAMSRLGSGSFHVLVMRSRSLVLATVKPPGTKRASVLTRASPGTYLTNEQYVACLGASLSDVIGVAAGAGKLYESVAIAALRDLVSERLVLLPSSAPSCASQTGTAPGGIGCAVGRVGRSDFKTPNGPAGRGGERSAARRGRGRVGRKVFNRAPGPDHPARYVGLVRPRRTHLSCARPTARRLAYDSREREPNLAAAKGCDDHFRPLNICHHSLITSAVL